MLNQVASNRTRTRKRPRARQLELEYKAWGGPREGAGRKPRGSRAGMPHRPRAQLARYYPVHITVRMRRGLPPLRREAEFAVLRQAFRAGREYGAFRLVHFVVLSDHLHLIVEAKNQQALARGMQGLLVRVARRLNTLWQRRGRVVSDRFHDRILKTPREVRNALGYVLKNAKKHGLRYKSHLDPKSSSAWFDGWRERRAGRRPLDTKAPVTAPHTWLLKKAWRRHGLLPLTFTPGAT